MWRKMASRYNRDRVHVYVYVYIVLGVATAAPWNRKKVCVRTAAASERTI